MKHCFLALALLYGGVLAAQSSLERQVVASQGASSQTEHIRLDWTLGEPAVATLRTSSGMWTEGFQQPTLQVESLQLPEVKPVTAYDIRVMPNPVASLLSLRFSGDSAAEELGWELFNAEGKRLQQQAPATPSDQEIDVSTYPDGIYLLRFANRQGQSAGTFRIVKTH